jgi:hypothetical protein
VADQEEIGPAGQQEAASLDQHEAQDAPPHQAAGAEARGRAVPTGRRRCAGGSCGGLPSPAAFARRPRRPEPADQADGERDRAPDQRPFVEDRADEQERRRQAATSGQASDPADGWRMSGSASTIVVQRIRARRGRRLPSPAAAVASQQRFAARDHRRGEVVGRRRRGDAHSRPEASHGLSPALAPRRRLIDHVDDEDENADGDQHRAQASDQVPEVPAQAGLVGVDPPGMPIRPSMCIGKKVTLKPTKKARSSRSRRARTASGR